MYGDTHSAYAPGLVAFADVIRTVLRVRHDSPVDGPDALESWSAADGYAWRWSTEAGMWWLTVGERPDPRPLLRGPGGLWRVDMPPGDLAAAVVLIMLRAAAAIPPETSPAPPPATGRSPVPFLSERPPVYVPPVAPPQPAHYATAGAGASNGGRWGASQPPHPESVGASGYGRL